MNYQDQSSLRIIIFQRKRQSIALSVDCRGRWMSNTRTWLWSRGDSLLKHCRIVCFWLHTRLHWKWQKLHRHVWERVFSIFRRQSLVCVTHLYKLRKFMYRTVRRLLKHKTPILSTNNYKNYSKKQVLLLYVWPCFIRIGSIPWEVHLRNWKLSKILAFEIVASSNSPIVWCKTHLALIKTNIFLFTAVFALFL